MNLSTLRSREVALVADFLYDLHTPVAAGDFADHIVKLAAAYFKDFKVCFDQANLKTGHYEVHVSHEVTCSTRRAGELVPQSPSWKYSIEDGSERVLMITDFISQRNFEKTDFYQEVFKPWGVDYQLATVLRTNTHICGFHLHQDRPIREELRGVLQALFPNIERAFENAQRRGEPGHLLRGHRRDLRELGLTRRESEVLLWIAEGKRDAEIAKILGVSRRTASKHVERILGKLEAETRTGAVARAAESLRKRPSKSIARRS
jgi:DNA-binding CsgD family transcriptional regulator